MKSPLVKAVATSAGARKGRSIRSAFHRQRGFSLVELVVTIMVSTIVVGFMAMFITTPVNAYLAQGRRADLAESANNATRFFENDVRSALPESVRFVRNGTIVAVEMLHVLDVAKYRQSGSSGNAALDLATLSPDSQFSTLGRVPNVPIPYAGYLVIGHGVTGGNAYSLAGVITTASAVAPITTDETSITLGSAFTFTRQSPTQSIFFVSGPVAYICNETTNTLTRFSNYPIRAALSAHDNEAKLLGDGATSSVVARDITNCLLRYAAGTPQYGGLVTLQLTVSRSGETLRVMDQAQVENVL